MVMKSYGLAKYEVLLRRHLISAIDDFIYQCSLGGLREGEIPDPIPNSEVKTFIADGTVRKSMGE